MAKVTEKIAQWTSENPGKPWFSLELFPPATELGLVTLYERLTRLAALHPLWIDVTWGANGATASKTLEISTNALKYHGLDVMMHLTCTNVEEERLKDALDQCQAAGVVNVLALRGDPPDSPSSDKSASKANFEYAIDLVKYIRKNYGDSFCIAVAGYPDGHPDAKSAKLSSETEMQHLKEKVEAGADLVVTQFCYDEAQYLGFVEKAREVGISVPIIPGVMTINKHEAFLQMLKLSGCKPRLGLMSELDKIKSDPAEVTAFGIRETVRMCKELVAKKVPGFHFYTMNNESSTASIVAKLGLSEELSYRRPLPWRQSVERRRCGETVRPIYWSNRPESYLRRTAAWENFPNGHFGGSSAPRVFSDYAPPELEATTQERLQKDRRQMWGLTAPARVDDISAIFVAYLRGSVKSLPWCHQPPEDITMQKQLIKLNGLGALTINWQSRVNGAPSSDPNVGWGAANGFVYQKFYLEFFAPPESLEKLRIGLGALAHRVECMAVNKAGDFQTNQADKGVGQPVAQERKSVSALTWGIFPSCEVIQPWVADAESFIAWKDEAFALWNDWAAIYGADKSELLDEIQNKWYLVSVVDNDFVAGNLASDIIRMLS
mmetsp:Transcript_104590/g.196937  ORF Transcript_104590/g.196937 Transcript_104590/m.196937 type:complete len:606 (+) Transcript_104590:129-1946(+)